MFVGDVSMCFFVEKKLNWGRLMSLQGQHLEKSIDIFLSFSKYNKCKELFVRKAMTRGWAGVYFSNNNKINFLHMSIHYCFATFHNYLEKCRQGQTNG